MATNGPNLGLIENETEGTNWTTPLKALLRGLDGLVQCAVLDKDLATPPGGPSNGDRYIVATSGTGAWSGHDGKIARYSTITSAWELFTPSEGWLAWVRDENKLYYHSGSAWAEFAQGGATNLDGLTDVTISGASSGQVVKYNGSAWVNAAEDAAGSAVPFSGVRAYASGAQTLESSGTAEAMDLNSETFDTDGYHDNSTNNTRLTVPTGKAGKYLIVGQVTFAANATGGRRAQIRLGGSTTLATTTMDAVSGGSLGTHVTVATIWSLAETNYIELLGMQGSGGTLDTVGGEASVWLSMALIEPSGALVDTLDDIGDVVITTPATGEVLTYDGSNWVNADPGTTTPPATIYVATTGDDDTGDGTSGTPYATVGKALSVLPKTIDSVYTIDVANGTYASAIDADDFVCTGEGKIIVTGDTTTPANVSFTGTSSQASHQDAADTDTVTVHARGPVVLEIEGIQVNATADYGVWASQGARVIIDRCTITGTLVRGAQAEYGGYLEFRGNVTISGFSSRAIGAVWQSAVSYTAAGTLTLTGSGSGRGVSLTSSSFLIFSGSPSGLNITITGVQYGFAGAFNSSFTHQGASATITVDNATTPASSAGVLLTDLSSWSTPNTVVLDHLTLGFELNSISYAEATGTRTFTNLGSTSSATQNSVVYLP